METKFQMVAKTFQGLEDVLRDELIALGAENVELGLRMVTFEGDNEIMYKANLCCRTALRILKPIVKFTADSTDELYDKVRELDWEQFMGVDSTFAIDSTVNSADFTHSKFVTYRVKDGIADHFNDKYGKRPSIRLSGADVQLNVHIADNRVTISLDSSGEPLSKRGYRMEQTEAPINEVLAAGIIMKTGWRGECDFLDPMCGSGTFLVEAALIAANINPGIYREHFAFEKWNDFDSELFEEIYNDDSAEREFAYKIYGGDIDPDAVAIARRNIKAARVDDMVELVCRPFADWTDNAPEGIMVTNPPYGERLKPDNINLLYKSFGTTLKKYFQGWHAWMIGYRDELFAEIGLKPSVKIPLHNGALECSLREYVLFDGKYSDFRADGGSVANTDLKRDSGPKKVRHISDDDWEKEAKKFNSGKGFDDKKKKKPFNRDNKKRSFDSAPRQRAGFPDDDDELDLTPAAGFGHGGRSFDRGDRKFDKGGRNFDRGDRKFDRGEKKFDRSDRKFDGGDRNFHKDSRKFDRGDRKFDGGDRKFDKGGRNFDRGDRKFDGGGRNFDRGDRKFDGEGRNFDRGDRKFDGGGRNFDRGDRRTGINYNPENSRGPRLPESSQTIVNTVHMRSRKGWKKESEGEED